MYPINLIIFGKVIKLSKNCENLARKAISDQEMAVSTGYLASALTSSKACEQTSLWSDDSQSDASV